MCRLRMTVPGRWKCMIIKCNSIRWFTQDCARRGAVRLCQSCRRRRIGDPPCSLNLHAHFHFDERGINRKSIMAPSRGGGAKRRTSGHPGAEWPLNFKAQSWSSGVCPTSKKSTNGFFKEGQKWLLVMILLVLSVMLNVKHWRVKISLVV